MSQREFIAIMALLIGLSALAIDITLPALPLIAEDYALLRKEDAQQILTIFFLGFGMGQLIAGPVSDSFGRKPILLIGITIYIGSAIASTFVTSFEGLIVLRFLQGIGAAAPRVLALAIVRDCYSGRTMGRIMSLCIMTFLVIPILAPAIGQGFIILAGWTSIFWVLAIVGILAWMWVYQRLQETNSNTKAFRMTSIYRDAKIILRTPQTVGYSLAASFTLGTLFSYLASSADILGIRYDLGELFPLVFGSLAAGMMIGSFINAKLVIKYGLRRVSHIALFCYACSGIGMMILDHIWPDLLFGFYILSACMLITFTFIMSNFNTIALDPHGTMSGLASSLVSATTTTLGGLIAWSTGFLPLNAASPLGMVIFICTILAGISIYSVRQHVIISSETQ